MLLRGIIEVCLGLVIISFFIPVFIARFRLRPTPNATGPVTEANSRPALTRKNPPGLTGFP